MKPQVTINQNEDCDFTALLLNSDWSTQTSSDWSIQTIHNWFTQTSHDWSTPIFPIPHLYREEFRKQNITPQHIKQTKRLFRDFHIDLPTDFKQIMKQFKYYYELENWRRYYIVNQLNQMEKD